MNPGSCGFGPAAPCVLAVRGSEKRKQSPQLAPASGETRQWPLPSRKPPRKAPTGHGAGHGEGGGCCGGREARVRLQLRWRMLQSRAGREVGGRRRVAGRERGGEGRKREGERERNGAWQWQGLQASEKEG